jgi:hypothetical protein
LDELTKVHSSKGALGSTLNYFKPWVENILTDTSSSKKMEILR